MFTTLQCRICERGFGLVEMTQILPCLHMFCAECLSIHCNFSEVCPAPDCFSLLKPDEGLQWNACENLMCLKRLSTPIDFANCYQEATRTEPRICPLAGCGAPLGEEDDGDCDACKKHTETERLLVPECCKARICHGCFAGYYGTVPTQEELAKLNLKTARCPPGKCIEGAAGRRRGPSRKSNVASSLTQCMGYVDCTRDALRNFPSEQECDHEVCLHCLDRVISDCVKQDCLPMCPNDQCRLPYRFESVNALKALLPHHAKYFANLALEMTNAFEALRDDMVTPVEVRLTPLVELKKRFIDVKCSTSEEDEAGVLSFAFARDGTLGELVREVRRALRILPTDKVYGFFVRREDGDDEQLLLNGKTCKRPMAEYNLEGSAHLIVDITGIVMTKKQRLETAARAKKP